MNPTRLWIYGLLTRWMPETRLFALKVRLLRWCGAQVGENVRVCSSAVIRGNGRLVIGNDVWIGSEDYLSPVGEAVIRIGDCCDLAPRVTILTGTHEVNSAATPGGGGVSCRGEGQGPRRVRRERLLALRGKRHPARRVAGGQDARRGGGGRHALVADPQPSRRRRPRPGEAPPNLTYQHLFVNGVSNCKFFS